MGLLSTPWSRTTSTTSRDVRSVRVCGRGTFLWVRVRVERGGLSKGSTWQGRPRWSRSGGIRRVEHLPARVTTGSMPSYRVCNPTQGSFILKELKKSAENHIGGTVERVVLAVPVDFDDDQIAATKEVSF